VRLAEHPVDGAATAARFAEGVENAMGRVDALLDRRKVVGGHGLALALHDGEQLLKETTLGAEDIRQRGHRSGRRLIRETSRRGSVIRLHHSPLPGCGRVSTDSVEWVTSRS